MVLVTDVHLLTMDFAHRLAAARKQAGLTQQALAETIGIHVTQVRRYEAGTSQPTLDALKRIAVALHVSIDALVFAEDERGPDDELRLAFEATNDLDAEERAMIKNLIEACSSSTKPAAGPPEPPARLSPSIFSSLSWSTSPLPRGTFPRPVPAAVTNPFKTHTDLPLWRHPSGATHNERRRRRRDG